MCSRQHAPARIPATPARTAAIAVIAPKRAESAGFVSRRLLSRIKEPSMKLVRIVIFVLCSLLAFGSVEAQHRSASRPNYGGGKHSKSHGGHYPGGAESSPQRRPLQEPEDKRSVRPA